MIKYREIDPRRFSGKFYQWLLSILWLLAAVSVMLIQKDRAIPVLSWMFYIASFLLIAFALWQHQIRTLVATTIGWTLIFVHNLFSSADLLSQQERFNTFTKTMPDLLSGWFEMATNLKSLLIAFITFFSIASLIYLLDRVKPKEMDHYSDGIDT